jgi:hypothetical protein
MMGGVTTGMTQKDAPTSKRYTVPEAAKILGVGTHAVRKRIVRDTIPHEKDEEGRVHVYLDAGHDKGHDVQDQAPELVESLREQIGYLQGVIATRDEELQTRAEELRRRDQDLERRDHIIAALTERIPRALEPPSETPRESPETVEEEPERAEPRSDAPGAREGTRRPQPASGVLGNAAILTLFVVGLLLVSGAAAFAAYMYEDPVFGPFVRVLPITSLVAGAFGGIVGYVAGRGTDFSRFLVGGGIMGLVAMAVAHFASVMVKGEGPADWGRSFFAMGLVLVSTWAMFTSGAYIGKVILLRSGEDRAELLKILASIAAVIATLFVGIITVVARN